MQTTDPHHNDPSAGSEKLPGIRHVIAVASAQALIECCTA